MDSLRHQEANTKMYVEDLMAEKKKKAYKHPIKMHYIS